MGSLSNILVCLSVCLFIYLFSLRLSCSGALATMAPCKCSSYLSRLAGVEYHALCLCSGGPTRYSLVYLPSPVFAALSFLRAYVLAFLLASFLLPLCPMLSCMLVCLLACLLSCVISLFLMLACLLARLLVFGVLSSSRSLVPT